MPDLRDESTIDFQRQFLFPKNSNFRADYTAIFHELRACAEETGSA